MKEDQNKVLAELSRLNGNKQGPWEQAQGFNMMPQISYNPATNNYDSTINKGISVKLFINTITGEIKVYWADKFMVDR